MERVSISDSGVEVQHESSPLVSMYGKQMRPGTAWTDVLPWAEIAEISLDVVRLPPDDSRHVTLEIDLTWGEFVSVGQQAHGFAEAVAALAARSGHPVPNVSTLDSPLRLWPPAG